MTHPITGYTVRENKQVEVARQAWPMVGLALIVLFSVAGNLYWRAQNIMLVGRDSTGHLERTVKVAEVLADLSPTALYGALTVDDYRPPLLYLIVQPFYRIFGISFDSAQLANILLFALVIILTYVLGRRFTTAAASLFAALIVSLLPMPVAMARLFYMEHLLTATLLCSLLALLASTVWTRHGWSMVWGATLGIGMLVKWTFPIYLFLPVLFLMWKGGLFYPRAYALRSIHVAWKRLGYGVLAGVLFLAIWFWPNRGALDGTLSVVAPVVWFLLTAATVYLLTGPGSCVGHFWGGIFLGLLIASLWYLPRAEFLVRLSDVAFGTDRGNQESIDPLRFTNYTRYPRFWITHHMGRLATVLILPPAIWGWTRRWSTWRRKRLETTLLLLTLVSPFFVLLWLAQANPRNLVPIVPIITILVADSLLAFPRRWAQAIGTVWTIALGIQWGIFTFDDAAPFYDLTRVLWVEEDYSTWPATRTTDPANWIQPDVLETIGNPVGEPATLGMLVDTWQLHRGSLRYLIAAEGYNIELMSLTEWEGRGWSDMLANQWILVKDGDNSEVHEPGFSVVQRILGGDALFHALYEEAKRYVLPNGETVYLYHRTAGPRDPYAFPVLLIDTSSVADAVNGWSDQDTTVYFSNADVATWVGIHDLVAPNIIVGAGNGDFSRSLDDVKGTIVAVSRYDTSDLQRYLRKTAIYATEFSAGEFSATLAGRSDTPPVSYPVRSNWAEIEIAELEIIQPAKAGSVLPLRLVLNGDTSGTLKISLRLVDPAGAIVFQRDETALSEIRTALYIPPDVSAGTYVLRTVLYDPATLTPIPDRTGETEPEITAFAVVE